MSLQFNVEEFIRSLVSDTYNSSDEDMEIDVVSVHDDLTQDDGADSDIEIIACYRDAPVYPPQLVAGRAMTTDFDTYEHNPTQSQYGQSGPVASTTDPSDSLIEWLVGSPNQQTYNEENPRHQIAHCSELEPIPSSPMSPPLAEQGPSVSEYYGEYPEDHSKNVTGLGTLTLLEWQLVRAEFVEPPIISKMAVALYAVNRTRLFKRKLRWDI